MRLITVMPSRSASPYSDPIDETALAPFIAEPGTVLLRGIIVAVPPDNTLWLTLPGAGTVPLVAAGTKAEASLRDLDRRWAIVRGAFFSEDGIVVRAVQAEVD